VAIPATEAYASVTVAERGVSAIAGGTARAARLSEAIWLVSVHGEHDVSTQARLETAFGLVDLSCAVVIDLADTQFIDTSTLATLLHCAQHAADKGGIVVIVAPATGHPRRVFEVTALVQFLNVFETRDDALRAIPADYRRL
jgi:anti-anti-sigma factor